MSAMKTLRPIAVSIAVILVYSSMNVLASHSFGVKNQTAAGTPPFVIGQLGTSMSERTHQRSIRRS